MAVNTSNTILKYSTDGTAAYKKLCDITSYSDMGSAPSKLDATDLTCAKMKKSILGLQDVPDLTFEANYDVAQFKAVNALAGQDLYLELCFGDDDGSFKWQGQVAVFATGGGIDELRKMKIACSATTEIAFSDTNV